MLKIHYYNWVICVMCYVLCVMCYLLRGEVEEGAVQSDENRQLEERG
jgi:hypothetical protein